MNLTMDEYTHDSTVHTIEYILNDIEMKKTELNPKYQRKIVWDDDKQSNFIHSVFTGIVPNPIVFNIDKNRKSVCIDGKQRCTSLIRFKNNRKF